MGANWLVSVHAMWMVHDSYGVPTHGMCTTCDAACMRMGMGQQHALEMHMTADSLDRNTGQHDAPLDLRMD